jgi:F0F1-type ATP synthase membrane subunit b/b'
MEGVMPTAKATTKKAVKSAGKPAQKAVKKVTLDDVWATIAEIAQAHKETEKTLSKTLDNMDKAHKETEKTLSRALDNMDKAHSETEKTLSKALVDLEKAHKETEKTLNRAIGGLSNTVGSLVEHIMTPDLPRKFKQFGFTFNRVTTVKWTDGNDNIYAEIDGLLENGNQAMVVEVKTTLRCKDIDDHLKRMERVRKYADDHGDNREFIGAMAATIIDKDTKEYALSRGFFVIEPSGEDVKITRPISDPTVW